MTPKSLKKIGEAFIGELVIFYLKDMDIAAVTDNGESMKISSMTDGIIVDVDENYFYVGGSDGTVHKIISMDVIGIIEKAEFASVPQMGVSYPSDEGEVH